jgi:hypothetical protein
MNDIRPRNRNRETATAATLFEDLRGLGDVAQRLPPAVAHELVDVTGLQGEARLLLGGAAQRPLERRATGTDDHDRARADGVRYLDRLRAERTPGLEGLGPLLLEHHRDLWAEHVGVLELHDPASAPRLTGRTRVPVHRHDLVPPTRQGRAEEETRRARSHDHRPHSRSPLAALSVAPRLVRRPPD